MSSDLKFPAFFSRTNSLFVFHVVQMDYRWRRLRKIHVTFLSLFQKYIIKYKSTSKTTSSLEEEGRMLESFCASCERISINSINRRQILDLTFFL